MKTLLALIIVSMLTVLCACNSVAPPDRQNTPAEALSDNGNGDGLSSDFTDDSTGADVSETTSEESEITSGEESDQSEPEGDRSEEEEQSETENSQSGTSEQSESSSDEEISEANTVDGDTAPVSELVLFVPAGNGDNELPMRPPIVGEGLVLHMPHNVFVDNDGTINIYDFVKQRIVSFRNGALVDQIDFDDYMYFSYYLSKTPSSDRYHSVAGDSEYIYLIGLYEFDDENNVDRSTVKICVINRSDKTGTFYDVMPEIKERRSHINSNDSMKLNGRVIINLHEFIAEFSMGSKTTEGLYKKAFATDNGLSVVDRDSVIKYSSDGADQMCYTIAGSSTVSFRTDGLPGYRYNGKPDGRVIAVTGGYLYFRTWSEENQFTSYIYKVERSSGKIIGYVKHAKPVCREITFDYYVTDNDELYYMESILSYDTEKCGTSVYKETFGNDFESIRIKTAE